MVIRCYFCNFFVLLSNCSRCENKGHLFFSNDKCSTSIVIKLYRLSSHYVNCFGFFSFTFLKQQKTVKFHHLQYRSCVQSLKWILPSRNQWLILEMNCAMQCWKAEHLVSWFWCRNCPELPGTSCFFSEILSLSGHWHCREQEPTSCCVSSEMPKGYRWFGGGVLAIGVWLEDCTG